MSEKELCSNSYCQTSDLGLRLEVDFVFPLSQEEQEQEQEEPHQNLPDRIELRVWNLAHRLKLTRLRYKLFSLGRRGVLLEDPLQKKKFNPKELLVQKIA